MLCVFFRSPVFARACVPPILCDFFRSPVLFSSCVELEALGEAPALGLDPPGATLADMPCPPPPAERPL
jgi:hypothetical protein